ncbi:histone deacetylase superfamily protein [Salinisphaera sp. PC39]|uniref:class II histone deacetylase n=1 Tax=Salinisphaera sp. PC39 TaxID=1304156 RepID=UPI00333E8E9D
MTTGFVWHELYMWHDTGRAAGIVPPGLTVQPYEHAENEHTKRRFKSLLDVSGLTRSLTFVEPRPATVEEILRVHTRAYVDKVRGLNETGGEAGPFTPMGPGSYDIALLSAGGVIALADAVADGSVDNGYALVRPPGHHAMPDLGMGFCLFGNAAIAGRHLLSERGLGRIAYVDWDVHHGNGTEAAFYDDPRALTISIHQDRCFPQDTGAVTDNGSGKGEGCNINVPLPPGSGRGAYEDAFDRVVLPALRRYRPEFIFVPCGFDGGAFDPLGRMMLYAEAYRGLTERLCTAAAELCGGRLLLCHEGGYSAPSVPYLGLAVMETLTGESTDIEDPFHEFMSGLGQQELQPHQSAAVDAAVALVERVPAG